MTLTEFVLARIADDEAMASPFSRWAAESKAKRLIGLLHSDNGESQGYMPDGSYGDHPHACLTCGTFGEYAVPWPCPTLQLLALPYAGHADYRDEWKP